MSTMSKPVPRRALPGAAAPVAAALAMTLAAACSSFPPGDASKLYASDASAPAALALPDPGAPGPFTAASYLYGSRYNPRRPEYAIGRLTVVTETADIAAFFEGAPPTLLDQQVRYGRYHDRVKKNYWGYDESAVPLNGKVWYPEGSGPFPLVVCVHGNHDMTEASEFGYDYLGAHLASRGIVFASVDENFLNGPTDGRENDARAAVLLLHARELIRQSSDPATPLYGKVDPTRVGIMGHSRGGEAASTAAIFNELGVNPDDASVSFGPPLAIRGVVSIAPVEGQYRASGKALMFSGADYLYLQGSADGDVSADMASRFFNRGAPAGDHFRVGFWIYGANHCDFNTTWSGTVSEIPTYAPNRLGAEAQRRAGLALITAFFEASFGMEPGYRDFLRDWRSGRDWLPTTLYVTRWREGGDRPLADFEEDADPRTGTEPGWTAMAEGVALWQESMLPMDMGATFFEPEPARSAWWGNHQDSCAVFIRPGDAGGTFSLAGPPVPADGLRLDIGMHGADDPFELPGATVTVLLADGGRVEGPLSRWFRVTATPSTWIAYRWTYLPWQPQTVTIPLEPGSSVIGVSIRFDPGTDRTWFIDRVVAYGQGGSK